MKSRSLRQASLNPLRNSTTKRIHSSGNKTYTPENTFNLIMPRKVFATVQVMCNEYEEKFREKLPTARLVEKRPRTEIDAVDVMCGCPPFEVEAKI